MSTRQFVVLAGNIGVGKSTLAARIAQNPGWVAGYESVEDNPYLKDFYYHMRVFQMDDCPVTDPLNYYSFALQTYFLASRMNQHIRLASIDANIVCDRSVYEDKEIFAKALVASGALSERDYDTYLLLYNAVVSRLMTMLCQPTRVIYLRATPETCLDRVRARDRSIETGVTYEYLNDLHGRYERWVDGFDLCPVHVVDANKDEDCVYEQAKEFIKW
jgi:deoxyadenosine/deoxycytidine kinase